MKGIQKISGWKNSMIKILIAILRYTNKNGRIKSNCIHREAKQNSSDDKITCTPCAYCNY